MPIVNQKLHHKKTCEICGESMQLIWVSDRGIATNSNYIFGCSRCSFGQNLTNIHKTTFQKERERKGDIIDNSS